MPIPVQETSKCALCPLHIAAPYRHCLVGSLFRSAVASKHWNVTDANLGSPVCCSHFAPHRDCSHPTCDHLASDRAALESTTAASVEAQNAGNKVSVGMPPLLATDASLASLSQEISSNASIYSSNQNKEPEPVEEAMNNFLIIESGSNGNTYNIRDGAVLHDTTLGRVYCVIGNLKYWYPNWGVYTTHGTPPFTNYPPAVMDLIPTSPALMLPRGLYEGQVVHDNVNGRVSRLVLGRKCWYPTPAIYDAHGTPPFTTVSHHILNDIPDGPNFA